MSAWPLRGHRVFRDKIGPVSRIARHFLSRRNAVVAMAALAGLLALASMASEIEPERLEELRARKPVRVWVFERLHPEKLTRSPLFLALPGFIGLSVCASMVQRGRGWWRARSAGGPPRLERFVARRFVTTRVPPAEAAARLNGALRPAVFPPATGERLELHGSRGQAGFAGSMIFHAGLLVMLAGVSVSALGRFQGEMVLPEGEPMPLEAAMLRASPPEALAALAGTWVGVNQVAVEFAKGSQMTDASAVMEVRRPGGPAERQVVSVNVPARLGDFQVTLNRYGFAPEIEAADPSGRTRAAGLAVVRVIPPGTEDSVALDGGGELKLAFYPDFAVVDGKPMSRTAQPLAPVLAFRWIEGGREVAAGRVARGSVTEVAGHRVAFPALRYWADFLLARDPGLVWFALAAGLIVAGLAVRFFWYEQSWRATLEPAGMGTRVDLALSSRYFPAFLERRADDLARTLEGDEKASA